MARPAAAGWCGGTSPTAVSPAFDRLQNASFSGENRLSTAPVRRSTDYGTVILHAALVATLAVTLATGLRIATDDPEAEWIAVLDAVLPTEHLWYRHLVSGALLTATLVAYAMFVRGARLEARIRLDKARLAAMLGLGSSRSGAANVVVVWVLLLTLLGQVVTGVAVFAGGGRWLLSIHLYSTFLCVLCIGAHVVLHALNGGMRQLLRIVRPGRLVIAPDPPDLAELLAERLAEEARVRQQQQQQLPPQTRRETLRERLQLERDKGGGQARLNMHPLATALVAGLAVLALAFGAERASRETLHVVEILPSEAPKVDGELSDPVWAKSEPVSVLTTQGGDFGGTHQSLVEVRAVHDGTNAYFAFVWEDPTRSLKHLPLVKRQGHWHVGASRDDLADERKYNEDKLSVLLARPTLPLLGAAIHLAHQPLSDKPGSSTGRGLHYLLGGGIADVWEWRASHAGPYGNMDNCHFGSPEPAPDTASTAETEYGGGFALDPGPPAYRSNIETRAGPGGATTILPVRLPKDVAAISRAMGRLTDAEGESESMGARWWMTESETVPYSAEADAALPDGTVVPSIVMADELDFKPNSVRGSARWAAGRWTLEVVRRLYTASPYDVPIKTGTMLWVAAFDHAEKRHTRHLRPFTLEVD